MIKQFYILSVILLAGIVILNSCRKEEDTPPAVKPDNRIFIINEGPFQGGSGSLSIYYRDTEEAEHHVFETVNGFPLGNIAQSVSVHNDKVYIVVNNAGKIEIAAKDDLVSTGSVEGLNLPRYFLGVDEHKGYVSSWDNKVYVIDLNTNAVTGSIPTATGPEQMLKVGEEVWVLNQGGFSYDSTITIINSLTDEVTKTLVVGDKPSGIVEDKNGLLWVICSGNGWNGFPGPDDTKAKLISIDPDDHAIISTLEFPDAANHPGKLVIDQNGETIFYNYPGGLYSQDVSKQTLELEPVIATQTMYYGLGFDPVSELIFVTDPLDYVQNGKVYMIDPVTKELVKSFDAGVIPGEMFFN
ncbi:MAG: DUF5074 domain-containing protein [Bacteroidota bacterium]